MRYVCTVAHTCDRLALSSFQPHLHCTTLHHITPAGKTTASPVASATVPAAAAIGYLSRDVALAGVVAVNAVVRARDAFAAAGGARERAWSLTGACSCVQRGVAGRVLQYVCVQATVA